MTKALKISAALITTTLLTGCGGFEMVAFLPIKVASTMGDGLSKGLSRGLGDLFASGLACALTSGLNVFGPRVAIELEAVEFNFVTDQVRALKIVDHNRFWDQLEQRESLRLRVLVQESYDALDEKSALRAKPPQFYSELLALGFINAARENVQVGRFTFARHIRVSKDPVRYESFLLTVKLLHAGNGESKAYSTCE